MVGAHIEGGEVHVQALLLSLARFTPPFLCLGKIPPASVFLSSHAFGGASSLFQWPAASRWTIPIVTLAQE
jgi:hypothetical protein